MEMSDDELLAPLFETDHCCHFCEDPVMFGEDAVLVCIHTMQLVDGNQLQFSPSLAVDGDFEFEPLVFHDTCWSGLLVDFLERVHRGVPSPNLHSRAFGVCPCCNEYTVLDEYIAWVRYIRVHRSKQQPSAAKNCARFEDRPPEYQVAPFGICSTCTMLIEREVLPLWDDDSEPDEPEFQRYLAPF